MLQPNASVRPFLPLEKYTEADPEFYLRPKPLVFDAPNSRHRSTIHGVGTSSLGALEGMPTLSNMFQGTLQRPFEAWSLHRDHEPMWSTAAVPQWLNGPNEDDAMSDTDSDEELDPDADMVALEGWPTIEQSKTVFLNDPAEEGGGSGGDADGQGAGGAVGVESARRNNNGIVSADIMLPRDITMALLSQRRAQERKPRWDAIPEFVRTVDSAVAFPKSKLSF